MRFLRVAAPAAFCLFASCASAPRVTTIEERAEANALLTTIETALAVLATTGKIPTDHYATASGQVADLRAWIASTETTPVVASDVLNRVLALAAAWAIKLDK